jgi:Uma2 family endonuclease
MATAATSLVESRFVLRDIAWETYLGLRREPANFHVRMTYDGGALEMMSPSRRHEQYADLIGCLVVEWAVGRNLDISMCRTMTFQRKDLAKGLEPDNCYYIEHEAEVRGTEEIDFTVDPPPDLAVEVELTRATLNKLPLYAAFKVPEVWRFDGAMLEILILNARGGYDAREHNRVLPGFPAKQVPAILAQIGQTSDAKLVAAFRKQIAS